MNIKRTIALPLGIIAAILAVGWLGAPAVQAHNALATPSCTGLSWSATNYERTDVNSIVVKVDGTVVHSDPDFKASDVGTWPWSQTANHTWSVVVNAPGTNFDRSFSGTWQACVVVTTTTTLPTTTTTLPATTTTVAQTTTTVQATTTLPATTVPATTVPPVCATTPDVGTCAPPAPPTTVATDVAVLVPEPVLPRTGLDYSIAIPVALMLIALGGLAVVATRRRPG